MDSGATCGRCSPPCHYSRVVLGHVRLRQERRSPARQASRLFRHPRAQKKYCIERTGCLKRRRCGSCEGNQMGAVTACSNWRNSSHYAPEFESLRAGQCHSVASPSAISRSGRDNPARLRQGAPRLSLVAGPAGRSASRVNAVFEPGRQASARADGSPNRRAVAALCFTRQ
jgi:hypothetical protein